MVFSSFVCSGSFLRLSYARALIILIPKEDYVPVEREADLEIGVPNDDAQFALG